MTDSNGSSLEVLGAALGAFPEVSRLNPEFVPGRLRLKLTLRIEDRGLPASRDLFEAIEASFPTLARHRCCGRGALAREAVGPEQDRDPGVNVAHLVEHLIIDVQHFIGRMSICSGITCAYRSPHDRYDIFVEAPEEKVAMLGASVAVGVSGDLLAGRPVDPHYRCIVETARAARDGAGKSVRWLAQPLESTWGSEAVSQAIDYLRIQGFLAERAPTPASGGESEYVYES